MSYGVCDLRVEGSEEAPLPDLSCPVQYLHTVVEIEVGLTSHLYLQQEGEKNHLTPGCA